MQNGKVQAPENILTTTSTSVRPMLQTRGFTTAPAPPLRLAPEGETQSVATPGPGYHFGLVRLSPSRALIQPRLRLGPLGGQYEQEAERVAGRVVDRLHASRSQAASLGQYVECQTQAEADEALRLQPALQGMAMMAATPLPPDVEAHIQGARRQGQPLAASLRTPLERMFGADFSGVRVHTDARADRLNHLLDSRAFTIGQDIFFRQGAHDPDRVAGQQLLAHELTHIVQQHGRRSTSIQRAPQPLSQSKNTKEKRKREEDELYSESEETDSLFSEFSASDDDEETKLSPVEKMQRLMDHGVKKKEKLLTKFIEKIKGVFNLSQPHASKVYAARRSTETSKLVEKLQVGAQIHRIGAGTGYFIQAGGNSRPEKIQEASAEYRKLFEEMRELGKDPNAAGLYKLATGETQQLESTGDLSDPQIARMAYYYMNNDASAIERQLGQRTQLTEHLSKFTTISNVSELSRSLEATDASGEKRPYDATILIKQGLKKIAEGEKSFREVYYQGKGGKDSIFLGATNQEISGINGVDRLRRPFVYDKALENQMSIFPDEKSAFKAAINSLKTNSKAKFSEFTKEKEEEIKNRRNREQIEEANELLTEIQEIDVPKRDVDLLDFLNDQRGPVHRYKKIVNQKRKDFSGNAAALTNLDEAEKELEKKKQETENISMKPSKRQRISKQHL